MFKKSQPNFPIFSGRERNPERRENNSMRYSFKWVGIICMVVSVLFAVEAGATTPFADDLPDIRLIRQGAGSPELLTPAFDLDEYVIDNDNTVDELSWSLSPLDAGGPVVNIDSSSPQPALHEVDVLAHPTAGVWRYQYTVTDPDLQPDTAISAKKYSSFWVTEPKFTADNRLSFQGPGKPRFTQVMLFDGSGSAISTPALTSYVTPSVPVGFGPLIAHDLTSGAPQEVARGMTIDILGGLGASVLTPSGVVALTPTGALSCAVLIAIPAVLQGSTFGPSGDWDGAVIMVAPAKSITRFPAATAFTTPTLAQDTGFEDIPSGAALQPGQPGSSTMPLFITGGWRATAVGTFPSPTFSIITPAQLAGTVAGNAANQFAGATSGNVLRAAFNNATGTQPMFGNVASFDIKPALPGEVYGISLNIATDIPSAQTETYKDKVSFILGVQTKPDQGIILQSGVLASASGAPIDPDIHHVVGLPTDGRWQQMYTEFIVPGLNQAVDQSLVGGTGTVNMMEDGFLAYFRVQAAPNTPAFNVYIDNIYIYCKGMSDLNFTDSNEDPGGLVEVGLANGVTAFTAYNAVNPAVNGPIVDFGFEQATIAANNWIVGDRPGIVTVATPSGVSTLSTFGRLGSSGSMRTQVTNGTPSDAGATDGTRYRTRGIAVNGIGDTPLPAGTPDMSGEGYYGISFWVASDAATVTTNPGVRVALQEIRPTLNQFSGSIGLGPSVIPVSGQGWYQYAFLKVFPNKVAGQRAMQRALVSVDVTARQYRRTLAGTFGSYSGTNMPGYNSNSPIYVDDLVIHRVRDDSAYFNYSLFE